MNRLIIIFLLSLIFFGCKRNNFSLIKKTRVNSNIKEKTNYKIGIQNMKQVSSEKLATLFISPRLTGFPKTKKQKILNKPIKHNYRVIADWQINGKRFIKLKDTATGKEQTINDFSLENGMILLNRSLFKYTIKINNKIMEIKR